MHTFIATYMYVLAYLSNEVQHPLHAYSGADLFLVLWDTPTETAHYQSI